MDRTEFTRLTTKYLSSVYKTALCNCRNAADAEDIVQDSFCALFLTDRIFPDDEAVKRWLLRIAINKSRDLFRSAWRRKTISLDEVSYEATAEETEGSDLLQALQLLPIKDRSVLHLFYYENYSTREISQILQISEGTVRTRLSRARKKLQMILKEVN